ncbi:MAG: uracil-DNA glycosylase [Candidatus Krumholzibacteriia bacterium]
MSDDLRSLLADLAGYLEQQQQAGGVFYLEEAAPADLDQLVAATASEPAPAPAPTPAPVPAAPPKSTRPAGARDAAFQAECQTFVTEALAVIARAQREPAPVSADPAGELAALADEVRACTACPLCRGRRNAVPGAGHPSASLMLVGEAPGQAEDEQGLPFVGRSGQLLTDILKAIGFSRQDVFIGNVLKCRPPNNRDPLPAEVAACEVFLRRQIAIIQPRIILCLGRIAAQTLLGTTASLGSLRRSVHVYAGVPLMATYHPAALLRNPANKRDTWDDVRKLRALHDALGSA